MQLHNLGAYWETFHAFWWRKANANEMATVYEGMQISEPTPETPIRTYQPVLKEQLMLAPIDSTFKPGFVAQAYAFRALLAGETTAPAAGLEDAHSVLKLAEELAGTTFDCV